MSELGISLMPNDYSSLAPMPTCGHNVIIGRRRAKPDPMHGKLDCENPTYLEHGVFQRTSRDFIYKDVVSVFHCVFYQRSKAISIVDSDLPPTRAS